MNLHDFFESPEGKMKRRADWARDFEITRGYIAQLEHQGKIPSLPVAIRINNVTEGKVTPFDWGA